MQEISLATLAKKSLESGTGLALRDDDGSYLFALAGTRYSCDSGSLFYCGIGGHRQIGEDWITCGVREAMEEIGTQIEVLSADVTWYLPHVGGECHVSVPEYPTPLAIYEMTGKLTERQGEIYHIVIYEALLRSMELRLDLTEVAAVIALKTWQVIEGNIRRPSIKQLLAEGATLVAEAREIDHDTLIYPVGTATALGRLLSVRGMNLVPPANQG